ncbi:hypothetical protein FSST1_008830 [Fusarium sambucinum]
MDAPRRDHPPFRVIVDAPQESATLVATADAQQDVQSILPNNVSAPASPSSSRSYAVRPNAWQHIQGTSPNNASTPASPSSSRSDARQHVQGTSTNNAIMPASTSSSRSDAVRPPPFASRWSNPLHWYLRRGTDIEYNTIYRRSFLIWAIHNCIVVRSNAIVACWVAKNVEGIWNLMPPMYPGLHDNCQVVCIPIDKVAEIAAHHGNNISAPNSSINGFANGSTNGTNVRPNYFYPTDREELILLAWRYHQSPAGVWFDAQGQRIRSDLND